MEEKIFLESILLVSIRLVPKRHFSFSWHILKFAEITTTLKGNIHYELTLNVFVKLVSKPRFLESIFPYNRLAIKLLKILISKYTLLIFQILIYFSLRDLYGDCTKKIDC
ncbi:hypothetical protein ACJX0J_036083, partial [Zea mays]